MRALREAATFQFVNPKACLIALTAAILFLPSRSSPGAALAATGIMMVRQARSAKSSTRMPIHLPPATRNLLLANVCVFVLQQVLDPRLVAWFYLWPPGTHFQPWQLISYGFLHEGFLHIFVNMFALFMFGTPMERYLGTGRFVVYYFVCLLTAGLTQLTVSALANSSAPTLGASGAIFGLLLAFAMYFPRQRVTLLFPPIPMPAWAFVTIYGLFELFMGVTGSEGSVAHFAHLGGMLGGAAMILIWRVKDGAPGPQR